MAVAPAHDVGRGVAGRGRLLGRRLLEPGQPRGRAPTAAESTTPSTGTGTRPTTTPTTATSPAPTSPITAPPVASNATYWILEDSAVNQLSRPVCRRRSSTRSSNPHTFLILKRGQTDTVLANATPVRSFASYAEMAGAFAAGRSSPRSHTILYDNEHWAATPVNEQQQPIAYARQAETLAHQHGMRMIFTPAINLALVATGEVGKTAKYNDFVSQNLAGQSAQVTDVLEIQAEQAVATPAFSSFVSSTVAQARAANPSAMTPRALDESCRSHRHGPGPPLGLQRDPLPWCLATGSTSPDPARAMPDVRFPTAGHRRAVPRVASRAAGLTPPPGIQPPSSPGRLPSAGVIRTAVPSCSRLGAHHGGTGGWGGGGTDSNGRRLPRAPGVKPTGAEAPVAPVRGRTALASRPSRAGSGSRFERTLVGRAGRPEQTVGVLHRGRPQPAGVDGRVERVVADPVAAHVPQPRRQVLGLDPGRRPSAQKGSASASGISSRMFR